MDRKLRQGIISVFFANMINVLFSLVTNFLLPKYLSVDSYAAIKTYQLYVSYVGLLHFGFVDGVYLKYGGRDINLINQENLHSNLLTMRFFQIVVTVLTLSISIMIKDTIFLFFTLSILPLNMNNYFKFLYQATGEFKKYGKALNVTTAAIFAVNMFLLFVISSDDYAIYLMGYVVVYTCVWLYLEGVFLKNYGFKKSTFRLNELIRNIKEGFFLTLGNLASILLTSMDRWFVKFLMDTVAFAQYSFAVSIENFLNLAITPITTTLFNYFCREKNIKKRQALIQYIVIFATLLPSTAFGVKLILEYFLTDYMDSCGIVFILFASQMFGIIIKGVYVNLYKVEKRQKLYFIRLIMIIILGFVLNIVLFIIWHCKETFALATLISMFIWFVISGLDFKCLGITKKIRIYLILQVVAFITIGYLFQAIIGFCMYIIFTLLMLIVFMRSSIKNIFVIVNMKIFKK